MWLIEYVPNTLLTCSIKFYKNFIFSKTYNKIAFSLAHSCQKNNRSVTFLLSVKDSFLADFSEGSNLRTVEAELMTSLRIWGPFCTQKLNSGVASVSSQTVRRQVSFNLQKFYSALHKISHTSDRGSLPEDFFHQPNRE